MTNRRCADLFGYDPSELHGLHVSQLVPEGFRERHREFVSAYLENPERRVMGKHAATLARRKNGTEFAISAALSASQTESGTLVTCIVREVVSAEPA